MIAVNVRGDGFHLELSIGGYERERRGGAVSLKVAQPPSKTFAATCDVACQTTDLIRFEESLRTLLDDLTGVATLSTLEDQVELTISLAAGKGTVDGRVEAHAIASAGVRGYDRPELPETDAKGATTGQRGVPVPALAPIPEP